MVFGLISLGLCGAPFSIGLKQLFVIISTSVGVFFKFNLIFLIHRFDCKMIKYPDYIVLKPWVMSPYFVKYVLVGLSVVVNLLMISGLTEGSRMQS